MAQSRKVRRTVARVPGIELLRIAHAGAASGVRRKENAAASIYSLLAFKLTEEMVDIPEEMGPHYKALTA